jgi:outer membrane protein assembly factor BamB
VAAGKTSSPPVALAGRDTTAAEALLAAAGLREGWALVVGLRDGALVEGLLRTSNLHVVAVEADAARADLVRRSLDGRGLFDTHRLSVFTAGAAEAGLPPYFASLICSETDGALPEAALRSLRPYGGVAAARIDGRLNLHRRDGPLPGSADWIHEFVDEGNTLASRDKLVKAPLGLLWYGGPAADTRLYFDGEIDHQSGHGLNPQPSPAQIIEGRMILHGPGVMAAFDIYTGRKLWETPLPKVYTFGGAGGGLGIHSKNHSKPWEHPEALKFEVPPAHRCRASGFDYVSVADGVYIGAATKCIRLNPADGKVLSEWKVPLPGGEMLCWGALRVNGDLLIAAAFRPQDLIDAQAGHDGNGGDWAGDRMPMKHILVMDRHSGKLLWHRTAVWGFLNRAIAVGNDRLYCADLLLETSHEKFTEAKRPLPKSEPIRIHALDLRTGKELWSRNLDVQIKVLHYSKARDLLVAACRNLVEWKDGAWVDLSKDVRRGTRNRNAVGRMRGIRGADGSTVWEVADAPYFDPHIILDDLIIDRDGITYNLLTGKRHERPSRITGLPETWSFKKSGCNHLVACEGMVTWRTAFYDLAGGGGVMPLKGMDAGCSPTLLPAGGVLSIANFGTHHKRNRMTAMAMVHTPENDLWTTYESSEPPGKAGAAPQPQPIRRIGYNLGAPGDRVSADGVVWLDVGSKTAPGVTVQPADAKWFEFHPSRTGSWIASSGVIGAAEISLPTVTPAPKKPAAAGAARKYTVRLHFVEPEGRKPGERVFSVALEGKVVLTDLDVVKEAGAPNRPLVREIQGVEIAGNLEIRLTAAAGATVLCGVELIAE